MASEQDAAVNAAATVTAARNNSHDLASVSSLMSNASGLNLTSRHGNATTDGEQPENVGAAMAIFYGVLIVMVASQSALLWWKRKHKRSYELTTLLGLWLFPAVCAFHFSFWQFCAAWVAYTCIAGYFLSLCVNRRQLDRTTPCRVYAWFLGSHKVSVVVGVAGYALLVAEVFGAAPLMRALHIPRGASLLVLWYGLYFGILGRDLAEVASDRIAAVMSSGRQLSVSLHNCGICGSELHDARSHLSGEPDGGAASVQLACCKQLFHPLCIRGWSMVGKKDTCPTCREKLDLRQLYADRPWETRNLGWIQMLDAMRYLIVWNPMLLVGVHFVLKTFGVAPHPHDSAAAMQISANGTALANTTLISNSTLNATTRL